MKSTFLCLGLSLPISLLIMGCQNSYREKDVIVLENFDRYLMLSRDNKTNQLYFQSKNGEINSKCGRYWYSDTAGSLVNDYQRNETNLNQLLDINSLMLDKIIANEYYLHDKNYRYTVILTLCDNQVSYKKIN